MFQTMPTIGRGRIGDKTCTASVVPRVPQDGEVVGAVSEGDILRKVDLTGGHAQTRSGASSGRRGDVVEYRGVTDTLAATVAAVVPGLISVRSELGVREEEDAR